MALDAAIEDLRRLRRAARRVLVVPLSRPVVAPGGIEVACKAGCFWRQTHLEELEEEHRKRLEANEKIHAAQVRRQKEYLRLIGVPDLSPEEVTERTLRREYLPKPKAVGSGTET
jgi:hypothetical protein